jgi:hypothetical protein
MATVSQLQEKKTMTIGSLNRKPKPNFTYNNNLLENVNEFKFLLSKNKSEISLKENSSQLNNCYNSIHCNFLFVNN